MGRRVLQTVCLEMEIGGDRPPAGGGGGARRGPRKTRGRPFSHPGPPPPRQPGHGPRTQNSSPPLVTKTYLQGRYQVLPPFGNDTANAYKVIKLKPIKNLISIRQFRKFAFFKENILFVQVDTFKDTFKADIICIRNHHVLWIGFHFRNSNIMTHFMENKRKSIISCFVVSFSNGGSLSKLPKALFQTKFSVTRWRRRRRTPLLLPP